MDPFRVVDRSLVAAAMAMALVAGGLEGQEETSPGWENTAELTFVLTSGNASSSTFGLKNATEIHRGRQSFKLSFGAVRTESGITTRTATGTPDDFTVSEATENEVTAENYFVKGRFDQDLGDAVVFFTSAEWDRNTFAGIQNRYGFVGGFGKSWIEEDTRHLKTDLGLTYTIQKDVVEVSGSDDSFLGLRGSFDFLHPLSQTTEFTSALVVDQNLGETDDLRADWTNAIAVAMSDRLALKAGLQILYDNEPAFAAVPLGDEQVFAPLGKTDTVFTVALVVNF